MNKRLLFLVLLFLGLGAVLINRSFIKYVYVSPQTNIETIPCINKSIKHLENNFNQIMFLCKKNHKDMKYVYKNYYGSGFLKENTIPNDLDVSVGVDLGIYEYDGTNENKIAKDIEDKISLYHMYSHVVFEDDKKVKYIIDKPSMIYIMQLQTKSRESVKNIQNGIAHVMNNEEQIVHFNKKYKENDVDYTFILNNNEILVNEIEPLFAYTKGILYNSQMADYPREISILPDFYVKIKNTKTNEIKNIELIEESFLGERFQLSRRFFVPIVFTGNNSLKYIKNLNYLKDDEKYFETRMFNYFRYINEIEVFFDYTVDPIKLIKRMHQCADIIKPALNEEEASKIYGDIRTVMNNTDIQTTNEYKNLIKNLDFLCSNSYTYQVALQSGYIQDLLRELKFTLDKLAKNEKYNQEIKVISKFQNEIFAQINLVNNDEKLSKLHSFINDKFIDISVELTKIVNKNVENRQEYYKNYLTLKNIAVNAGYKKIDIYQKDLSTIYVLKNDFTKNLTTDDLKTLAKENNMPQNVEYKLIDEKSLQKGSRSEFRYVRFKTTKTEDENFQKLKEIILKDKTNFKIKRKYVF